MFEHIDQQIIMHEKYIDLLYEERKKIQQCIQLANQNACTLRVTEDDGAFTVVARRLGEEGICASRRLLGAIQGALIAIGILSHVPLLL